MAQEISREELGEKLDRGDGIVLVDVLGEPYYRHSHLPGAISLPLEEIERAPEALPDKDADIVVYCTSPIRSASQAAARGLATIGYHNVRDYPGGKQDWIQAGLPHEGNHHDKEQN